MGKKKMDALGDRMKDFYENRTRIYLPRRTYTVIRIDGKAFHTWTKGLKRPFDEGFINDMDETAKYLCKNIQGAKLAFVQSDEISIVLTDFDDISTDAWFDGNIQKMVSVSASMATSKFNQLRFIRDLEKNESNNRTECAMSILSSKLAEFDARVFTIPNKEEVINYLIFRQQDTVRNSISSVAQSLYSSNELKGKNQNDMQELCFQKGINWNDLPVKQKRGRLIIRQEFEVNGAKRNKWVSTDPAIFSQDKESINKILI
jgi:tRNA(His) 5'-end guanylyltransferase